jgi:type II secretory pathway component PulK
MRIRASHKSLCCGRRGSVLVIVLWIAFGLVSLALYFANSMNFELRASDNRVSAMAADQAIEGAARYINYLLATNAANGSNGIFLALSETQCRAVPVGDAHFWLIGRDTNTPVGPGHMCFGLVDEASKLNLNMAATQPIAASNALIWLPGMTVDLTQAILDWVNTNATGPTVTYYAMQQPSYQCKCEPFETVDELRLLYGADMDTLVGEDANRNGILDPNETDANQNGMLDPGILEYVTVYSREANTNSDGSAKVNISATEVLTILGHLDLTGSNAPPAPFKSPLQFYDMSQMTMTEFALIATNLITTNGAYTVGRVNVNTASAAVLTCLLQGDTAAAQQLISYRQANPNNLTSIAWVKDALGQSYAADLTALEAWDCITTLSYQYTADIAAVGPYGRGYRRVKFVFDTSSGTPKILYRQDLTHLGWALGKEPRQTALLAKGTR